MVTPDVQLYAPAVIRLSDAAGARGLALRVGCATLGAAGKPNEDFHAVVAPPEDRVDRGVVVALADGVSGSGSARIAAEIAVRSLAADYYVTPPRWSIGQSLDRILRAANDWLWAQNGRRLDRDTVVAAVSVLVLRGQHYHLAHVGDTRVYRQRRGRLQQLTADHSWQRRDMRHVLRRAVGLDSYLVVDFAEGELQAGDAFLLVTDGVWEVLGDASMGRVLRDEQAPHAAAQTLVEEAQRHQAAYMGRNDSTALVLHVEAAS